MARVRVTWLPLGLRRRMARWRDDVGPVNRQRIISALGRRAVSLLYRRRPVPVRVIVVLARLAGGADPIRPKYERPERGSSLRNPFLASRLAGAQFGGWTMTASALNVVEEEIRRTKPKRVLEFGSGFSTVCVARYMMELHGSNGPSVCSFEQDEGHAVFTRDLLGKLSLDEVARVVWAPLAEMIIEGEAVPFYDLDSPAAKNILDGLSADMLLIDGPAGESFLRRPALSAARPFLSESARFLLDDALREAELEIAEEWAAKEGIELEGIVLVGQGLLLGTVAD